MPLHRTVVPSVALIVSSAAIAIAAPPPPGIHYVYLVRHGVYDPDTALTDPAGEGLNALGRAQARRIAARLAALPVRPAALVTSTLRRARETADTIGAALALAPSGDSLLRECLPASDAPVDPRAPAAATAACDSALARAWAEYMTPTPAADRHDVLVAHSAVIRWFVSRALAGNPRRWRALEIANGSLTVLAVRADGTVRLVIFSDVGHLPPAEQTWTGAGAGWRAR